MNSQGVICSCNTTRGLSLDTACSAAAGPFSTGSSALSVVMGNWCGRGSGGTRVHPDQGDQTTYESSGRGRVLIFANPNSGSGTALSIFRKKLQPQLAANGIGYELVVTTGPHHAQNVVRERDFLSQYNAIIILSGDGLVYEVLLGLCERDDYAQLIPSLPIGIVPSGSGNGLLSALFAHRGYPLRGKKFMEKAVENVTSADCLAVPVNVLRVRTDTATVPAFLSVGWGLLADIDIESERWRKSLGSNRFLLGAMIRCFNLRTYRGRLSYKPYVSAKPIRSQEYTVMGRSTADRMLQCEPSTLSSKWSEYEESSREPKLSDEVPRDWVTVEEDFVFVYALSISHISQDGPMMPKARLNDDRIYLTYALKKDVTSRIGLINFLSAIESEKHLEYDFFKTVEVSAFRLEPIDEGSYIAIDGEVVNTSKIQASVTDLKTAVIAGPESV